MKKKYKVIVNVRPKPTTYEMSAARLVAELFEKDVKFVQKGYSKTADLQIGNQMWEIKAPEGSKRRTIEHQFQRAEKQAKYLIIDCRRVRMDPTRSLSRVRAAFRKTRTIKRVVYIDKDEYAFELTK